MGWNPSGSGKIASLRGPGVITEGDELYTVDSSGSARNTIDDGSGNATVTGDMTVDTAIINTEWRNPHGQTYGKITLSLANITGQNGLLLTQSNIGTPVVDVQSNTDTSGDYATSLRHEGRSGNVIFGFTPEMQMGPPGNPYFAVSAKGVGPTNGALFRTSPPAPTTGITITSGTAWQNTTGSDVTLRVPVTYSPTSSAAATLAVGVGSGSTPTTVEEESEPAGLTTGRIHTTVLYVPANYYALLTVTNGTLGSGVAYPI